MIFTRASCLLLLLLSWHAHAEDPCEHTNAEAANTVLPCECGTSQCTTTTGPFCVRTRGRCLGGPLPDSIDEVALNAVDADKVWIKFTAPHGNGISYFAAGWTLYSQSKIPDPQIQTIYAENGLYFDKRSFRSQSTGDVIPYMRFMYSQDEFGYNPKEFVYRSLKRTDSYFDTLENVKNYVLMQDSWPDDNVWKRIRQIKFSKFGRTYGSTVSRIDITFEDGSVIYDHGVHSSDEYGAKIYGGEGQILTKMQLPHWHDDSHNDGGHANWVLEQFECRQCRRHGCVARIP